MDTAASGVSTHLAAAILGLITGTLFVTTRGVSSGIVAHATHNLVVTLFAGA